MKRKIVLAKGEIYHVFNRGVARMPIFTTVREHKHFIEMVEYCHFATTPLSFSNYKKQRKERRDEILQSLYRENNTYVEIVAFCLMPNHYHFIVKQMKENGISKFIGNIQNGYGKFFNMKHNRTGPVFQPSFHAVRVETDEQLLHVSRYTHLNPTTGFIVEIKDLLSYKWSSLPAYLDNSNYYPFLNSEMILQLSNGRDKYRSFVLDQAKYQQELGIIKHLLLE